MLTDKELDEIFREGFAGAEFPMNEGAWAKAEELIQQADPLALDNLVKAKFAQATFTVNHASWLKALALIEGAYRALFLQKVLYGGAALLTMGGLVWYLVGIMPYGNMENHERENATPSVVIEEVLPNEPYSNSATADDEGEIVMEITPTISTTKTDETAEGSKRKSSVNGLEANSTQTDTEQGTYANTPRAAYTRAPFMPDIPVDNSYGEQIDEIHLIKFEEEEEEIAKADQSAFRCFPGTSHYIGVLLGVAGSNVFEGESLNTGMSSSPVIGLRYALMLQHKWTINANILYQHRPGTNRPIVYESYEYNFGMDTVTNYLTPARLHYLELPIYASYQVSRLHKLSAGMYASWLMTTYSYRDVYVHTAMNTEEHFETSEYGVVDGLRQWDYGFMLGYDFRLHENLQMGLRFQYGLPDVTKDGYFIYDQNDHIMWLKLIVEYRLSR